MGLTLSFDEFHGPANSIVTATVTLDNKPANHPIKIKESDRPVLRVSGMFPFAGDYSSNIVIRQNGKR